MAPGRFACACCGHLTQTEPHGSFEICPVCLWQDDGVQLRDFADVDGPNRVGLVQAQANYASTGASETRFLELVRAPMENEPRDPAWRPLDAARDQSGSDRPVPYWLKP